MTNGVAKGMANKTRIFLASVLVVIAVVIASALSNFLPGFLPGNQSKSGFIFTSAGDYGANRNTKLVLESIAEKNPDLHIMLGDLSYNQIMPEKAWCDFVLELLPHTPKLLLAGNHESDGPNGLIENFASCIPNPFPEAIGDYAKEFYFDYPKDKPLSRFILISPDLTFSNGETYSYARGSTHFEWLEKAIREAHLRGIPWVIVGMHKVCMNLENKTCEVSEDLMNKLFDEKVDVIIQGHAHIYARSHAISCVKEENNKESKKKSERDCVKKSFGNSYKKGSGTIIVISGTGGAPLRNINEKSPGAAYFSSFYGANREPAYGFSIFNVTKNRLTASFINAATGDTIDRFLIKK